MRNIRGYPDIYQAKLRGTIDENVTSNILDAVIKRIKPQFNKKEGCFHRKNDWRARIECDQYVLDIGQGFKHVELSTFKKRVWRHKDDGDSAVLEIAYVDHLSSFGASRKDKKNSIQQTTGTIQVYVLCEIPSTIDENIMLAEIIASAYIKTISSYPNHYILYDKSFRR